MMKGVFCVILFTVFLVSCAGGSDEARPADQAATTAQPEAPAAPEPVDPPTTTTRPNVAEPPQASPEQQPVTPATGPSHCSPVEWTVFSCQIEGSQTVVSVCASTDLTRTHGYLQYRFGRPGAVELAFPEDLEGTQDQFMWQTIGYSGGWDTRIQFTNAEVSYQLYDKAIKVSISEKEFLGGIIIKEGKAVLAELACDTATLGPAYDNTLGDLYERIPEGSFIEDF